MSFFRLFIIILGISAITLSGAVLVLSDHHGPFLPANPIIGSASTSALASTSQRSSDTNVSRTAPPSALIPRSSKNDTAKVSAPGPLIIKIPAASSSAVKIDTIPSAGALNSGEIMRIVNEERAKEGLPALSFEPKLSAMADAKAKDMIARHYFAHVAPDGTDVVGLAKRYGYDYLNIGENLAMGDFTSSADVMKGWMNSPGHRANILDKDYTEIGVSAVMGEYEGRMVWYAVQEFGRPGSACPSPDMDLDAKIKRDENDIKTLDTQLSELRRELDGSQNDVDAYNKLVDEYNGILDRYNALAGEIKTEVALYNSQVDAFNACAGS